MQLTTSPPVSFSSFPPFLYRPFIHFSLYTLHPSSQTKIKKSGKNKQTHPTMQSLLPLLLLGCTVACVSAQGGCCCDMEWHSNITTFSADGTASGTGEFFYSLQVSKTRIDFRDTKGALERQFWSDADSGSTWVLDLPNGDCQRTHTKDPRAWMQLCWDESNPNWHIDEIHGTCPDCKIQWRFLPDNSTWIAGHPCNAERMWGPFETLPWVGANFSEIVSTTFPESTWAMPEGCPQ